uniref:VWFA domain-containing protein n=1 Tax=Heterorhabditis bacteriophora TaxID=37862 RepID=A0A1I7WP34_HETBA
MVPSSNAWLILQAVSTVLRPNLNSYNKIVEGIKAVSGHASYSKAVSFGLENLHRDGRADANAVLIIVGDGENIDSEEEKLNTQDKIKQTPGLTCLAVDSSAQTDTIFLHSLTGDSDKVFPYERNADFAKQLLKLVTVGDDPRCQVGLSDIRARIHAAAAVEANPTTEWVYSTIGPLKINRKENDILRDIHEEPLNIKKFEENKALIEKLKKMTTIIPPKIQSNSTSIPKSTTLKRRTEQQRSSTSLQTSPLPIRVRTTSPASLIPSRQPSTPSFATAFPERRRTTEEPEETPTTFKPGCLLDVIVVLDSSGSVEETFRREKELAAGVIERLRIGTDNARVSIIKFAGKAKVKTVWSFADIQTKRRVLRALNDIPFSSGTTAIHSALLKVHINSVVVHYLAKLITTTNKHILP